jgi:GTP-binding protein
MIITSATFVRGITGTNEILSDGTPQVAFVGRSNVGKSSVINSLTGQKDLARTSAVPGSTQQMNVFLINNKIYLIDLPGYGYAKASFKERERIQKMIYWYLFESDYEQKKVIVIIDAKVGPTDIDRDVLQTLHERGKDTVVVVNKIDKLKRGERERRLKEIQDLLAHTVIAYSSWENIGVADLAKEIVG